MLGCSPSPSNAVLDYRSSICGCRQHHVLDPGTSLLDLGSADLAATCAGVDETRPSWILHLRNDDGGKTC